jgi:hypothetical protein
MPVYIGEISAEVSSADPLATPTSQVTMEVKQRDSDSMLDSIRRIAWLADRVAADAFDD